MSTPGHHRGPDHGQNVPVIKPTLACIAVGVLLVACSPGAPTTAAPAPVTSSTPTPTTYSCGEIGKTCSAEEYAEFRRKQSLVEEATAVYQRYHAEVERLNVAGGVTEPTPILLETAEGEFLRNTVALLKYTKDQGATVTGQGKVASIDATWSIPATASVGLKVCEDWRGFTIVPADQPPQVGQLAYMELYLRKDSGVMKIFDSQILGAGSCA